jgi:beta-ribofuranosylaminobenzene 5'-phosphate synthase
VTRIIHVSTPSRLHFGLLRLHESSDLSFGGFGMMIDRPRVELTIAPAHDWSVSGIATNREISFAQKVVQSLSPPEPIRALAIHVESVVPQHRGLGGGTQLALAIAAGVRELFELSPATADELADSVGRGLRSAIGTHGFLRGGLIWERGRAPGERLAPLTARVALPAAWRVVLIAPSRAVGLHGPPESVANSNPSPKEKPSPPRESAISNLSATLCIATAGSRGDVSRRSKAAPTHQRKLPIA